MDAMASGSVRRQRVAAYALVRADDRVLLVRASPASGAAGRWWLPGGGLEFGEAPEDGVRRELREETGLEGRVDSLLDVTSDVAPLRTEPVELHSIRLIYAVSVEPGALRAETSGSSDEACWFAAQDVSDLDLAPWLAAWWRRRDMS